MKTFALGLATALLSLFLGLLIWQAIVYGVFVPMRLVDPGQLSKPEFQKRALRATFILAAVWLLVFGSVALALFSASGAGMLGFAFAGAALVPVLVIPNVLRVLARLRTPEAGRAPGVTSTPRRLVQWTCASGSRFVLVFAGIFTVAEMGALIAPDYLGGTRTLAEALWAMVVMIPFGLVSGLVMWLFFVKPFVTTRRTR